ncbi:MAG: hypothetical protein QM725_07890 [Lacibacter sp.]
MHIRFLIGCLLIAVAGMAQPPQSNPGSNHGNRFEQLGYLLQSPNEYRTASGAPGPKYWQQRADYDMNVELDEANLKLTGSETVTYFNNSPDVLTYLWLQLDGNIHDQSADNLRNGRNRMEPQMSSQALTRLEPWRNAQEQGMGVKITKLTDAAGVELKYTINKTMMRIDLPAGLKPGQKFVFKLDWNYKIPDRMVWGSRGGFEYFPEDGNHIFTMSQFYPRLAVYSDFQGWQHTQFSGGAEFALTFGNFKVKMTVPSDFVIAATGECQNYKQLLTPAQYQRGYRLKVEKM